MDTNNEDTSLPAQVERKEEELTPAVPQGDIVVVVGGKEYACFGGFLAHSFDFFKAALYGRFKETNRFEFPDRDPQEWEWIMKLLDPLDDDTKIESWESLAVTLDWFSELLCQRGLEYCDKVVCQRGLEYCDKVLPLGDWDLDRKNIAWHCKVFELADRHGLENITNVCGVAFEDLCWIMLEFTLDFLGKDQLLCKRALEHCDKVVKVSPDTIENFCKAVILADEYGLENTIAKCRESMSDNKSFFQENLEIAISCFSQCNCRRGLDMCDEMLCSELDSENVLSKFHMAHRWKHHLPKSIKRSSGLFDILVKDTEKLQRAMSEDLSTDKKQERDLLINGYVLPKLKLVDKESLSQSSNEWDNFMKILEIFLAADSCSFEATKKKCLELLDPLGLQMDYAGMSQVSVPVCPLLVSEQSIQIAAGESPNSTNNWANHRNVIGILETAMQKGWEECMIACFEILMPYLVHLSSSVVDGRNEFNTNHSSGIYSLSGNAPLKEFAGREIQKSPSKTAWKFGYYSGWLDGDRVLQIQYKGWDTKIEHWEDLAVALDWFSELGYQHGLTFCDSAVASPPLPQPAVSPETGLIMKLTTLGLIRARGGSCTLSEIASSLRTNDKLQNSHAPRDGSLAGVQQRYQLTSALIRVQLGDHSQSPLDSWVKVKFFLAKEIDFPSIDTAGPILVD